jgi:hypothetical protein
MGIEDVRREVQYEANLYDRPAQWLQTCLNRARLGMSILVWILPALAIWVAWMVSTRSAFV